MLLVLTYALYRLVCRTHCSQTRISSGTYLASLVICLFILKAAWEIGKSSMDKLVDRALYEEDEDEVLEAILSVEGVLDIRDLKTRMFADRWYVDVNICVRDDMTVVEGHDIASRVHAVVEERFPKVKHCMVHVDPVRLKHGL